jgi:DNA-binding beta-propeller fold protein YncE
VAKIAFAVYAATLTLSAAAGTAQASLLSAVTTFGSQGSGAGQLSAPVGVAVGAQNGTVYVADSGNARVDEFDPSGNFIAAFGWGVADGKPQSEVCTSSCQAGIPGSGPGQFSNPTSVAFGVPGGPSAGKVFVGDQGNNVVEEFDADGQFIRTIDGTTTPQGHFQGLVGISVDQSGNLWTADGTTNNVDEFNAQGAFVQQWQDTHGSGFGGLSAIAVDSTNGAVYLTTAGITEHWTLTGTFKAEIDRAILFPSAVTLLTLASASALVLDPGTGALYVDHNTPFGGGGAHVAVYDHNGVQLDDLSLPSTSNSQGLAFRSSGPGNPTGKQDLYLSDASNNNVTIYAPRTAPGAQLVTSESETGTGKTTVTLNAGIVPLGHDTTCTFQYVDYAHFNAGGYSNATSVPCTPADLGSSFTYQAASANVSGLTTGTVYHFRVVATSSAGTTTGDDQEFQAGPGTWAPFFRCPVDDPAFLAFSGEPACVASNSTHGSITLGNITTTTGNTNLQIGLDFDTGELIPASGGSLVVDPVQLSTPVGPVTAVTESAGTPSNFNLTAGIETGVPIITVPIKIQLENNPTLGPNCSIGSDQNPIVLNPENTDLSNAKIVGSNQIGLSPFDANGVPDLLGPVEAINETGAVQGDDTFAVPGATGCGPNGSLDSAVDAVAGLPSPSGSNHLVLDDASNDFVVGFDFVSEITLTSQQFANDWHVGFGGR